MNDTETRRTVANLAVGDALYGPGGAPVAKVARITATELFVVIDAYPEPVRLIRAWLLSASYRIPLPTVLRRATLGLEYLFVNRTKPRSSAKSSNLSVRGNVGSI
jgi:hypothetical protein